MAAPVPAFPFASSPVQDAVVDTDTAELEAGRKEVRDLDDKALMDVSR